MHRPHIVHASVSSNCFHVKSSTVAAPNVSSSVSIRFGIAFIAPLGRSRSRRYMFSGDVNMWRIIVTGRITRNVKNKKTCVSQKAWCHPLRWSMFRNSHDERIADEAPLLVVGTADQRDAECLGEEAGDPEQEEDAEDGEVLGLGLDADPVRPDRRSGARAPNPRR